MLPSHPTPFDLRFTLLGVPVRIHPFFWILALLIGPFVKPADALVWVVAVVVSILVHEFGHALVQRAFGGRPRILLYAFGGMAYEDRAQRSATKNIAISLAGPVAGFLLLGVTLAVLAASGHPPVWEGSLLPDFEPFTSRPLTIFVFSLILVNIFWGIFNLMPIYPLDGGQVAREVACTVMQPRTGIVVSLWISIAFCAIIAAVLWMLTHSIWNFVLMALLATGNYQALEAYRNTKA